MGQKYMTRPDWLQIPDTEFSYLQVTADPVLPVFLICFFHNLRQMVFYDIAFHPTL